MDPELDVRAITEALVSYDAILHNEGGAATFPLRTGDVIVIE